MPESENQDESKIKSSQADQSNGNKQEGDNDKKHNDVVDETVAATKEKPDDKKDKAKEKEKEKDDPPGGFDETPIPGAADGYTVKFTFHRATNLPAADLNTASSDPFIIATLTSRGIQPRHKEDPEMRIRTKTIHKSTNPEWNQVWVVGGIPSQGFRLKCRLYDEDPADHDDRLGNVTIHVNGIGESWRGIKEEEFDVKKRMGSKRAYMVRGCVVLCSKDVSMSGSLTMSIEVLGKSEKPYGRMYTIGDVAWTKHYSPMIGRLTGTKNLETGEDGKPGKIEKYDFQANQLQLQGPVPAKLYHRFVEFKPFVKGMFSKAGLRGRILNKALHHQHAHVYNYSNSTRYGIVEPKSEAASLQFLDMVHYDEGGRLFTYVITLDGLLRFTETGKEFGIDLLSKHTMHSDVNIYIACSGEFFVRRLSKPDKPADAKGQESHPPEDVPGGPPNEPPPKEAKNYELVIDNDSGTYRPSIKILPELKVFLNENFPGLHVVTKDCGDEELVKWKKEQREMKKKQGQEMILVQNSDDDISSSDEEALERSEKAHKKAKAKKIPKATLYDAVVDPKQTVKKIMSGKGGNKQSMEGDTQENKAEASGS